MSTVIYGMLKEERERNLQMQEIQKMEISKLRKGSIVIKTISGKRYHYLIYWKDGKVKTEYIGNDEEKIQKIKREIEKRKYLQGILKRLKLEYKQIGKIVKD